MNLFDKISEDIKKAMLARDARRLESLRGIKRNSLRQRQPKAPTGTLLMRRLCRFWPRW